MLPQFPPRRAALFCAWMFLSLVLGGPLVRAADAPEADHEADPEIEDVTVLPELEVKGARVEEFGFRFNVTISIPGTDTITVREVWPNTPASKAGLQPGDLILKVDGKKPSVWSMAFKPNKIQEKKWAELAAGKKSATLVLEVRAPGTKTSRTLTLVIPSPAPRWGGMPWTSPEGRAPAVVAEAGPLAGIAREVLEQGIWVQVGTTTAAGKPVSVRGYEWRIVEPSGTHRITVSQQSGKTEIALEHRSTSIGSCGFRTSPSGALNGGRGRTPKRKGEKPRDFTDEELRARFAAELDFWLHRVGRVTGRWPFEALPSAATAATPGAETAGNAEGNPAALTAAFLKLPAATSDQRALFQEAYAKLGLDAEGWAYTETSKGLNDGKAVTVRVDPSRTPEESVTLMQVDGKKPKDRDREKWRSEGRMALPGLAELPPLSTLVDVNEVRVAGEDAASLVFELPVLATNSEFPAEKFQARFRVNKTHRGFEDFAVKLREKMSVAGIATVTDAGLEARFRVIDPTLAPQPVHLKIGGGVRVLLVKLSRAFEITRTDFQRVVPYEAPSP